LGHVNTSFASIMGCPPNRGNLRWVVRASDGGGAVAFRKHRTIALAGTAPSTPPPSAPAVAAADQDATTHLATLVQAVMR